MLFSVGSWSAYDVLAAVCIALVCISLATYFVPHLWVAYVLPRQSLRSKYNASWALVTGASSGIGLALTEKLARDKLNVVMVAYPDQMLETSYAMLVRKYPGVEFRKCPCDLSWRGYMDIIVQTTKDLPISVVMNNAGYLLTGFFRQRSVAEHLANVECNCLAAVAIARHFMGRMEQQRLRGCICFTSSAAGYFPSPFVTMYGATKAFLSSFALSLSIEAADQGIDVLAVHPSYTTTNLYEKTEKLSILKLFAKFSMSPADVADAIINSVGRGLCWRDIGSYAVWTHLIPRVFDVALMTRLMTLCRRTVPDYVPMASRPSVSDAPYA